MTDTKTRIPRADMPPAVVPEDDEEWEWFVTEKGTPFRVPRAWVQPIDDEPFDDGEIRIENPTLEKMFAGTKLTPCQAALVPKLQAFLDGNGSQIFLLRGYAGTGKTFLMKGVVKYLNAVNRSVCLMAPTGRAAKVLSTRAKTSASTIHAKLYAPSRDCDPDEEEFKLVSELETNADDLDMVYIVDEASMVSDKETQSQIMKFGSGRLLADLVYFMEDAPCAHARRILFVGDTAQLPPVGMDVSPALSEQYLDHGFAMKCDTHVLTDIVRQKKDSGILKLATTLRKALREKRYSIPKLPENAPDIERIAPGDMPRLCWECMGRRITKDAIMVAHTNRRVQQLNRAFRRLQFPGIEELAVGDKLMVIMNTRVEGEFVCNGDFCQVAAIGGREIRRVTFKMKAGPSGLGKRQHAVDLEFQDVTVRLRNNRGDCFEAKCKILVNELEPDEIPNLSVIQLALFVDFKNRHPNLKPKTQEWRDELEDDPYFNALHVRYGYAVTCHKAQGGEWPHVYVDCAWTAGRNSSNYFRWLYTAITRAKVRLHVANYPDIAGRGAFDTVPDSAFDWSNDWRESLPEPIHIHDPDVLHDLDGLKPEDDPKFDDPDFI